MIQKTSDRQTGHLLRNLPVQAISFFLYQQINDLDEVRMHITKTLTEPLTNSNAQSEDIQLEVEIEKVPLED